MSDLSFMRFQIEGLGKKLGATIALHSEELQGAVKKALDDLCESGRLQQIVTEQVAQHLAKSVQRAVESWEVSEALKRVVLEALETKIAGTAHE